MAEFWLKFGRWFLGLLWSVIGGGVPAFLDALDDWTHYEGSLDWPHLTRLFVGGALLGAGGYWRSHKVYLQGLFAQVPEDTPKV